MSQSIFPIREIAKILSQDICLYQDWRTFYDLLEINTSEVVGLENRYKTSTIRSYELFLEILQLWVSQFGSNASLEILINILQKEKFVYIAEELMKLLHNENPSVSASLKMTTNKHFGIKKCITNFVGRDVELTILRSFVDSSEFLVTVTGMEGCGKSTLLQRFVNDLITADNKIQCIWFQCGHGQTLEESIQRFANHIEISLNLKQPPLQLFQKCINSLPNRNNHKTLLVFDNVDAIHMDLLHILKFLYSLSSESVSSTPPIMSIVTSTLRPIIKYSEKSIQLRVLSDQEAVQFLQMSLPPNMTEGSLNASKLNHLCKLVQNFPRMLQQAADYIKQKNSNGIKEYGIDDYITDFGSSRKKRKLLDHPLSPIEHSDSDHTTTFNSWRQTIRNLNKLGTEGRWAIKLHNLLSYLDSDEIPVDALGKVVNCATFFVVDSPKKVKLTDTAMDRLKKSLKLLKDYHLIDIDIHQQLISIHQIVKEVTRLRLQIGPKSSSILSEVLAHIQLNLMNTDCNNNEITAWDDQVTRIIVDLWRQAVQFPDLVEKYASVGVQCTLNADCPLQLLSTTVEQMTSIFPETNSFLLTAKINYFSRLCQDNDHEISSEGIYLLKSLVNHASDFLGGNDCQLIRARLLLEAVLKSKSRLSEFIQVAEHPLWYLDEVVSPLTSNSNCTTDDQIKKWLDLANAYEQKRKFPDAIDYYLCVYDWTIRVRNGKSSIDEKAHIVDKIKFCCDQAGICIDEYFNLDDAPSWEDSSSIPTSFGWPSTSLTEFPDSHQVVKPVDTKTFRWKRFFGRFSTKGMWHLNASDFAHIVKSLKLDMLPHR